MNNSLYKKIVKFKSYFISDSNKRKEYRENMMKERINPKNYKWGVSYSVFDGIELLEKSILSIRKNVDYVNVVYQKKSWVGNDIDTEDLKTLFRLKEIGLIDELIEYITPGIINSGKDIYERIKRNIGLDYAKKAKCNYFMTMDVDEFYLEKELEDAKKIILDEEITNSFCKQIVFANKPTKCRLFEHKCFVQFFCKINKKSRLICNKKSIALVDPTRELNDYGFFKSRHKIISKIAMYHYSECRKDIKSKIDNSSFYKKIVLKNDDNCVDVPDIFEIGSCLK